MMTPDDLLKGTFAYPPHTPEDRVKRDITLFQDLCFTLWKRARPKDSAIGPSDTEQERQRAEQLLTGVTESLQREGFETVTNDVISALRAEYDDLLKGIRKTSYPDPWIRAQAYSN